MEGSLNDALSAVSPRAPREMFLGGSTATGTKYDESVTF